MSKRPWLTNCGRIHRVQIVYVAMMLSNSKYILQNPYCWKWNISSFENEEAVISKTQKSDELRCTQIKSIH